MVLRDRARLRAGAHRRASRDAGALAAGRCPGGEHLSIEFIEDVPDDDRPRLGAWLELRTEDPAALMRRALEAGLTEVKHPGQPYYVMAPGGQVFTIAPMS